MSRFMHPSSVRYGNGEQWALIGETVETGYVSREFLKYVDHLLYQHLTSDLGTIYGSSRVVYSREGVQISIPLYDRLLELSLKEAVISGIEETVIYDRLLYIKQLIVVEGYKYFGNIVEVEFYFLSICSMPSQMLARYIALHLEQNQRLPEILKHVSGELRGRIKKREERQGGGLVHRKKSSFTSDSTLYKPRFIGDKLLLGFRFDCKGRYSRKQRGSRESLTVGSVSLGGFRGHVEYGSAVAIMTYGASNVRVWKYFDRYESEWNYLLKVK